MHPEEVSTAQLLPGQVGYIACNMKQSSEGKVLNTVRQICLTCRLQHTLVIPYIVSGMLLSPCLAFNPPRLWYVQRLNKMGVYSYGVYSDRFLPACIP
jgi:hypothetical protein